MLFADSDSFWSIAIRIINIQIGISSLFTIKIDMSAREDQMRIKIKRLFAPAQNYTHAIQIRHHRTDSISHASARTFDHQIGIPLFFDD